MTVDPLSDVLALVRARCEITGVLRAGGPGPCAPGPGPRSSWTP